MFTTFFKTFNNVQRHFSICLLQTAIDGVLGAMVIESGLQWNPSNGDTCTSLPHEILMDSDNAQQTARGTPSKNYIL